MIKSHRELNVFQNALVAALQVLALLSRLDKNENWTIGQQIRSCCTSVFANIAEAWRKRRYKASFVSKLSDAEGEAAETQAWLELLWKKGVITEQEFDDLFAAYEVILGQLVSFANSATKFAVFTSVKSMIFLSALGAGCIIAYLTS